MTSSYQENQSNLRVVKDEIVPPEAVGEWTLSQMQKALSRKLPPGILKTLPGKGNATYLPWHSAAKILTKYSPGWTWEVRQMHTTNDRIFLVGRLTITAKDGVFFYEATGTETLKKDEKEIAYGDPSSNAESMCFRRCAAKLGLALYLYDK